MSHKWIFIIFVASALACRAAGPYYVAPTGSDGNNGSTWTLAFKTISNGVAHAIAGDVVNVSNGVYMLTTNISIITNMTLRGQDRTNTIIQGQYPTISARGLYINRVGATVEEFTVTGFGLANNTDLSGYGGGVYIDNGTLRNCIITTNVGYDRGGGICQNAGLVSNCDVVANSANSYGGGIYASSTIQDCRIYRNQVTTQGSRGGGGVYAEASSAIIRRCFISNNVVEATGSGGGVYMYSSSGGGALIDACIIASNRVNGLAVDVRQGGGGVSMSGAGEVRNCVISNNLAYSYGGGVSLGGPFAYITAGEQFIKNCVIVNNRVSNGRGGGVCASAQGATQTNIVRNCLIAGNTASADVGGGVYAPGLANVSYTCFDACTIVSNTCTGTDGGGIWMQNTRWVANTIVYYNTGGNLYYSDTATTNYISFCCVSNVLPAAAGNITNAPLFMNFAAQDYRLSNGSPGMNAGSNSAWMTTTNDLAGRPRIDPFCRVVDIGAYEYLPSGALFKIR